MGLKYSHLFRWVKPWIFLYAVIFMSCRSGGKSAERIAAGQMGDTSDFLCCSPATSARFAVAAYGIVDSSFRKTSSVSKNDGMVFIKGGTFMMGATDDEGRTDEYPSHRVRVDDFWMDATEVTNEEFSAFVKATGYITTAERKPDWEEIRKQLPPGTAKPPEDVLVAGSLVFTPPVQPVSLADPSQWWSWTAGADWRHPQGPGSTISGKEHFPVVQVSWEDAMAYCKWAKKRLPTEAEWEYAARGGMTEKKYPWGDEDIGSGRPKANTWQGSFPNNNIAWDGFTGLAPVASFTSNAYGLFDMAGNVWEWCSDWYAADYYREVSSATVHNPRGAEKSDDPLEPGVAKKLLKGGSFMCNASYCKGYRVSSRMRSSPDTGLENTGFRCVSDP